MPSIRRRQRDEEHRTQPAKQFLSGLLALRRHDVEAWFHLSDIPPVGQSTTLEDREARHAVGVRRLRPGARVRLFDGAGLTAEAELVQSRPGSRVVEVRVVTLQTASAPSPVIHLASALPKGDRQSVLLSMATQLGMTSFIPLLCEHGVARVGPGFHDRATRICVEACKQCRRAHLPSVEPPASVRAVMERNEPVWVAHPEGGPLSDRLSRRWSADHRSSLTIVIGPEGGLSDEEIRTMREHDAEIVSLGDRILRTETAAVAMLASVMLAAGSS